ncbi:MAG: hypothetical protein JSR99_05435 [Proteobacteria bacterium]|nr:hypothetical protein [Pseudomonadota bacterium]
MRAKLLAVFPVVAALFATATAVPSDATGIHRLRSDYQPGEVIVAQSRFGNGSIKSIVRPGRWGWQVRLPGGAWTDCRRSCEETLRVKTVDLYEGNSIDDGGYGTLQRECGIFGCLGGSYEFSF